MENIIAPKSPYLIRFSGESNKNGALYFWENRELFPQGIQRCFWISAVAKDESRGNHAHWKESQVLVAMAGKLQVETESVDGLIYSFELSSTGEGLFIPPLHWVSVRFSTDAVLLGMSDRVFSEEDYIRDKEYFESLKK